MYNYLLKEEHSRGRVTYTFSVAMRQRQTPSLVLLFLCLNPPSILSHTYCKNNVTELTINNAIITIAGISINTSAMVIICVEVK